MDEDRAADAARLLSEALRASEAALAAIYREPYERYDTNALTDWRLRRRQAQKVDDGIWRKLV